VRPQMDALAELELAPRFDAALHVPPLDTAEVPLPPLPFREICNDYPRIKGLPRWKQNQSL
jgi:hypothetical protein